nr:hypothetical protein [Tanacetum cinerariifolium]
DELKRTKTAQQTKIDGLERRVKKLEKKQMSRTHKLKRLYKVGLTARVISSSNDEAIDKEDTSKQGRIDEIDVDEDIALVSSHDDAIQDEGIEDVGEEEVVEVVTTAKMLVDAAQVTTTIADIPISAAETIVTIALTITAESTKTNVKVQDKGKGKAKPIEEPKMPKKKKHQVRANKELAVKLQVEIDNEERIAKEKAQQVEEVNLAWVISSSNDEAIDKEDTSKQGRIDEIDVDEDIALVSSHDDAIQDEGIEDVGEEEVVEVVTTTKMLVDAAQVTTTITDIPISAAETIVTIALTITAESTKINVKVQNKGKGKAKPIEEPKMPKKKKHQVRANEELAVKLQVEIDNEERIAKEKAQQVEEVNLACSLLLRELKKREINLQLVGNKMHKAFPLPGESSHWQYKFPLPVEGVPTARSLHCYNEETASQR